MTVPYKVETETILGREKGIDRTKSFWDQCSIKFRYGNVLFKFLLLEEKQSAEDNFVIPSKKIHIHTIM